MENINLILNSAQSTIKKEGESILNLQNFINDSFANAVEYILSSNGKLIVTGIGKSANIAQKLVSTFNSTGQSSVFMHAGDAIHGDLGNIQSQDVILCLSKSGNTPEIKILIPLINSMGNKIISICGNQHSFLAKKSDWFINSFVEEEACPNNLAPTSSSTAQLVLGDALAICLLELRNFSDIDFARFHPGGSLGKKLFLKMGALCSSENLPKVDIDCTMDKVIIEISKYRLGATLVVQNDKMLGIITDGDIRRMIEHKMDIGITLAKDVMNTNPIVTQFDELAINGLRLMQEKNISQIVVLENDLYRGIVHIHDVLKEGIL